MSPGPGVPSPQFAVGACVQRVTAVADSGRSGGRGTSLCTEMTSRRRRSVMAEPGPSGTRDMGPLRKGTLGTRCWEGCLRFMAIRDGRHEEGGEGHQSAGFSDGQIEIEMSRGAPSLADHPTTPVSRSSPIWSSRPSSARIASVCSPSAGELPVNDAGVAPNCAGWRGKRVFPTM
jgi:hypothetical protein